jgi:DNA-binding transcriptional LysR family regulator
VAANDLDMESSPASRCGELRARRIGREELVIVAAAGSPLAKRRRLKPSDLRDEPWIVREDGSDTRRQMDAWFRRHRVTPSRLMPLQGPDSVKRAVVAGLGIALLPRSVAADELSASRLVAVATATPLATRDVWLVDHPHKHHGAACQAMLRMLEALC